MPAEENRDIRTTLSVLEIDTDLSPEDAAAAAADESAAETEGEDADGGGEGDGDGNEGGDGEAPATTVVVESVALPAADVPLVPPARPKKLKTPPHSPAAGKLGKGIMDKVPGPEKVKVFKREDETGAAPGKRWFIAEYQRSDVNAFSDYESFISRYVKPKYGPGEYDLVGLDAHGRETELGQVRLIADPTAKGDGSMSVVSTMLQQQKDRDEQWRADMKDSLKQPPPQDPLALMSGMMTLQKQMNSESEAGMSQTNQMMMAMMQQNQQMMMAILSKPKEEDPVMKMLIMKMFEDKPSGALPPPPPPPAAMNLAEIITAVSGAVGTLMAAVGGGGGGDDDFKEFLKTMLVAHQSDKLSTKDMIQLLTDRGEKAGTSEFRNAIDNMAAIMNVAQNVNKSQEGGAAAGFFDALAALFSNRDFAGSIANTIRAKTDKGVSIEQQRLLAERQRLDMQKRLLAREAEQVAAAAQGQPTPTPVAQQVVMQAPPVRIVQQRTAPTSREVQEAAEKTIARTGQLPQLPANTHEHINNIAASKDDGELVGKTVQMLIYFAEFEDWRGFTEQILGFVRDGNRAETKKYLSAFFEGLAAIHLIDPVLGQKIVRIMLENFDVIQQQMAEFTAKADEQITGEALLNNTGESQTAAS
jgi:hypothetical protein